ncbi:spermatogenesis-associated serine-rich protein 2 isoform X2 [Syngnathus acus]|uniref:spermatogenesis-associated serine-rich protein 2 isoform X2 n=1 Tax=Syngnathus acus TaxID=161584 RepID=UPI0018863744|nr:spermatogenesis-associated serine-rich protein 2 isoform X2 [Syngnathus acus]
MARLLKAYSCGSNLATRLRTPEQSRAEAEQQQQQQQRAEQSRADGAASFLSRRRARKSEAPSLEPWVGRLGAKLLLAILRPDAEPALLPPSQERSGRSSPAEPALIASEVIVLSKLPTRAADHMAKKNQKDTLGVVFDTRSKMVMSQGGPPERMKEKIGAVRAIVPNKSNNEIVLVLQHFENCVDKAVQAFLEGSAAEILKEWSVSGKKKPNKKKKPKAHPEAAAEPGPSEQGKGKSNGFHPNGSLAESLDSLSERLDSGSPDASEPDSEPSASELAGAGAASPPSGPGSGEAQGRQRRDHPALPDGQSGSAGKMIARNVERSAKDLQRCAASLTRYSVLLKEEMESSLKRMKQTFAELQSTLMEREVTLLAEMDRVKAEAIGILSGRQKRAQELRRLTERSAAMSEEQLTKLRADIKHFVSERKYDEDLGKALRFTFHLDPLKASIMQFGSVYHPQTAYSDGSRCSSAAAGPSIAETLPPDQLRPLPAKQIFQGTRRTYQGQGYQFGGSYHDRNPGRGDRCPPDSSRGLHGSPNHDRNHGRSDRGPPDSSRGPHSGSNHDRNPGCPNRAFRRPPDSSRGLPAAATSSTMLAAKQKVASHNGLPQRPARMARP